MTANELFALEHSNQNVIHLFLAGHFWQAWEKSAFFFTKYFENYEIHGKFIKKIASEMVYLGFSKEGLKKVREKCTAQNFVLTQVDEKHLTITGFTPYTGFFDWKNEVYKKALQKLEQKELPPQIGTNVSEPQNAYEGVVPSVNEKSILYASKEFYECTKYIFTRTGESSKLYRYGLGDKLRGECLDMLDLLHCIQMNSKPFEGARLFELFCRIRIKLRLLLDFRQLSEKQWFYINERLDGVKKVLRLESHGSRLMGANRKESGGTLPASQ